MLVKPDPTTIEISEVAKNKFLGYMDKNLTGREKSRAVTKAGALLNWMCMILLHASGIEPMSGRSVFHEDNLKNCEHFNNPQFQRYWQNLPERRKKLKNPLNTKSPENSDDDFDDEETSTKKKFTKEFMNALEDEGLNPETVFPVTKFSPK